jgi:hypothetical protein
MTSTALLFAVFIYAQGKNGVTQTAQAESTPVVAVSTAVADSGAATVESKTVKTEIQSPGVVTEYKEDGTKVVTINLSEIDENKLPEKYEAKVVLEAPIYSDSFINDNKERLKNSIYFVSAVDAAIKIDFDVSVDSDGNIYIYDPYMERIQKFSAEGKHSWNIQIKNETESYYDEKLDHWVPKSLKTIFFVDKGKIYVRDTIKNRIECIDETGKVIEIINVPKEIERKNTRVIKKWMTEERVIAGQKKVKPDTKSIEDGNVLLERGDIKYDALNSNNVISLNEKNKIVVLNNTLNLLLKSKEKIFSIYLISQNEDFLYLSITGNGFYNGIFKISDNGRLLTRIRDGKYWFSEEWAGGCQISAGGINGVVRGGIDSNTFVDSRGGIYLSQLLCCENEECVSRIRIIKLTPNEGR